MGVFSGGPWVTLWKVLGRKPFWTAPDHRPGAGSGGIAASDGGERPEGGGTERPTRSKDHPKDQQDHPVLSLSETV